MFENEDNLFDDLPDENSGGGDTPTEPTEDEKKKIADLAKAKKSEETRLQKAERELNEVRAKRKEAEAAAKEPEPPKKEEQKVAAQPDVNAAVQSALEAERRNEYLKNVANHIRASAKNRQEAELAFEQAKNLPPTGDAKLDADFAFDRIQKLRSAKRGYTAPHFDGATSFADVSSQDTGDDSLEKMSPGGQAHAKHLGITKEDAKKYKDGIDFNNLFNRR